jgi:hypothetical protein
MATKPDPTADVTPTLAIAMAAAFAEIEGATKAATNPHFKTKYADLGAVIDAIKPALINHNLFFVQCSQPSEHGVTVETVLHHVSGDKLSLGALYVPANKQDAQGFGSALTYCRRYSLMTAFGVPAEDDDGNAAAKSAPAARNGNANGKIDDAQWATLTTLIEQSGSSSQAFCEHFGCDSVKLLPAAKYQDAEDALKRKIAARAQKEPA